MFLDVFKVLFSFVTYLLFFSFLFFLLSFFYPFCVSVLCPLSLHSEVIPNFLLAISTCLPAYLLTCSLFYPSNRIVFNPISPSSIPPPIFSEALFSPAFNWRLQRLPRQHKAGNQSAANHLPPPPPSPLLLSLPPPPPQQ